MDSKDDSFSSVPSFSSSSSFSGSGLSVMPAVKSREDVFGSISNSKIGQVLRDLSPQITLTEDEVKKINDLINSTLLLVDPDNTPSVENYITLINEIESICKFSDQVLFRQAFSINKNGRDMDNLDINDPNYETSASYIILNQYQYNDELTEALKDPLYATDKDFILLLLSLEKDFRLTEDMLDNALNALQDYDNLDDFLNALDEKGDNDCADLLRKRLAGDLFNTLRIQNLTALDGAEAEQVAEKLGKIESDIEHYSQELESWDEALQKSAPILDIKPIHFMSPSFQAEHKANPRAFLEKEAHFEELAENCRLGIGELKRQRMLLEGYRARLLDIHGLSSEKEAQMEAFFKKTQTHLESVDERIKELTELHSKLTASNEGVLHYLQEAKQDKKDVVLNLDHFGFTAPKEDKGAPDWGTVAAGVLPTDEPSDAANYVTEDKLKPGAVRPYQYKRPEFSFKERAGAEGRQLYVEKKDDIPKDLTERKQFFLGMAAQILASRKSAPSELKPIKLIGNDETAMTSLYAALRHLAKLETGMKFDPDKAISWTNQSFNKPDTAVCDAMYDNAYDKKFKEVMNEKDKAGLDEVVKAAQTGNSEITAEYKEKLQNMKPSMGSVFSPAPAPSSSSSSSSSVPGSVK